MVPWYKKWLNLGLRHNNSMFLPFFEAKYSTIVCVITGSFITTLFLLLVKTFISSLTSHIIPPYHGSTPPTSKLCCLAKGKYIYVLRYLSQFRVMLDAQLIMISFIDNTVER